MRAAGTRCIPSAPDYVPGIYIRKLLQLAAERGVDRRAFRDVIPHFQPRDDEALESLEFTYAEYLQFVARSLEALDDSALGIRFGARFGIKDYGILGYALLSCRDLGHCLRTFQNLNALFGDLAELERSFHWGEQEVVYRCESHVIGDALRRFELQTALAQFMGLAALLADADKFRPLRVSFAFPGPADPTPYHELFHSRVRFAAERSELAVPRDLLDAPFALANQEAWEACEHQCELLCRGLEASGAVTERVRQIALRSPGEIPDLDSIARQLHVSSRTLRRRLADEHTTYQAIVAEVRTHLARRYLSETALAIKEVAHLLGYSEVANFQRAFKRQVGLTPGEFRATGGPAPGRT